MTEGKSAAGDHEFRVEDPPPRPMQPPPPNSVLLPNMQRAAFEHPGEWARIATYSTAGAAHSTANQLRSGRRVKNRPVGIWEFKSGKAPDGGFGIWARFTPAEPVP